MTTSLWQADGTQPIREVDFLIVGAGLSGCAAAYFATQAGRQVVITEKQDVALGASGRNAGFMITGLDTYYHRALETYGPAVSREVWQLSEKTHGYWRGFIERSGGAVRFDPCGSLLLAESPEEARELEQAARALESHGHPFVYYSRDPLGRGYHAAIEQPHDAAVHPVELARAVLAESGAELVANNALYHIEQPDPEKVIVYTRQYVFHARYVLLCVNAYAPLLDPYFIGRIIPTRAQALATAPLPQPVLNTCGYSNYGYMYYRMTFDGRLLVGGARHNYREQEHDTTEDRTTDAVQGALERYLRERFPEVTAPVERRWAGIMGFSKDGLPQVGTLPGRPRVGFAVGFTGHGLALAAGTAERGVDHLLTGASPGALDASRLD